MTRKSMLSVCLGGLLVLPASAAFACHFEKVSFEISCTQYKFAATGVLIPHPHSIKLSFVATPTNGGPPVSISKTIPVSGPPGNHVYSFDESVTDALNLVGDYGPNSISGTATLVNGSGHSEGTATLSPPQTPMKCEPRAGS